MVHDSTVLITRFLNHLSMEGKPSGTRRVYGGRVCALNWWLGDVDLMDATYDHLLAWRESLTLADSSIVLYVAAIRSFYNWAVREGYRDDNPATSLPVPHVGRRFPRPIGEDDLEKVIASAPDRLRPWYVLAGYAGLRCCEIARLRRECLYEAASDPYMIVHGKGNKERLVPLSPYVWMELERSGLPRNGWIFLRRDGKPGHVPAGTVSRLGNEHLCDCGIHATMHQLRHRFGTRAYAATRDLRVVQELMGHASSATTEGYAAHSHQGAVTAILAIQPKHGGLRAVPER